MVTRMTSGRKVSITWRELSEALSKAKVLSPTEDIANLTLVKPRALLIHTGYPVVDELEPPKPEGGINK